LNKQNKVLTNIPRQKKKTRLFASQYKKHKSLRFVLSRLWFWQYEMFYFTLFFKIFSI